QTQDLDLEEHPPPEERSGGIQMRGHDARVGEFVPDDRLFCPFERAARDRRTGRLPRDRRLGVVERPPVARSDRVRVETQRCTGDSRDLLLELGLRPPPGEAPLGHDHSPLAMKVGDRIASGPSASGGSRRRSAWTYASTPEPTVNATRFTN